MFQVQSKGVSGVKIGRSPLRPRSQIDRVQDMIGTKALEGSDLKATLLQLLGCQWQPDVFKVPVEKHRTEKKLDGIT